MQAIPKMMKALVLTAPGKFEIQEVPVPAPGPFEVLCAVGAVAICGTDPEVVKGSMAGYWPPAYPFIPGHEWAGQVVALGENSGHFLKIGDRVAGEAWKGCGHCANCVAGHYRPCPAASSKPTRSTAHGSRAAPTLFERCGRCIAAGL